MMCFRQLFMRHFIQESVIPISEVCPMNKYEYLVFDVCETYSNLVSLILSPHSFISNFVSFPVHNQMSN